MNFHGGNVYTYDRKLIDFSSNINPLGVPESFKLTLLHNMEDFTKYPDIHYVELRKSIGRYLELSDIECIVPGNGAIELLYRAIQHCGKNRLISLMPTFSEYSKAAFHYGIEYMAVHAFDDEYKDIDIELILQKADKDSAVIVCNPNNPTGTLLEKKLVVQLAEGLRLKNSILIVDEAFMEFTPGYSSNSMLDQINKNENLIIVKAVTKFFGMPGIRLGYAVSSNAALLHKMKESMEPWNVNTAAVLAGCSVLQDEDYISRSREWIGSERNFLFNGLRELKNLIVYPSAANFHLIKLLVENFDAWQLKNKLLEKNILIRTPEGFENLNGQFARLAVKSREDNMVLLEVLKEITGNM